MTRLVTVIVALLAVPAVARAQGDTETPPTDDAPVERSVSDKADKADNGDEPPAKPKKARKGEHASRDRVEVGSPKTRLTLPGGKFLLTAVVEANLAKGTAFKPMSVAPDLWIGVADRLSFGLYHSGRAATGFLTGFGTGLCFRGGGSTGFCGSGLGDVYTFAGAEARIGLTEGGFALGFVLGAQARAFDPELVLSGKTGFIARIGSSRLAVELAPMVYIGITQRKVMDVDYNVDLFGAPVTIFLRVAGGFSLAIQGGVTFVLKDVGNTWQIPAAAGFMWWLTPHVSLDAAFGLAAVADKDDSTKAFDRRSISVGLGYAL